MKSITYILRQALRSIQPLHKTPLLEKQFYSSPAARRIRRAQDRGQFVALIYLDVVGFQEVEIAHGPVAARRVLLRVHEALHTAARRTIPARMLLTVQNLWADDFAIYLTVSSRPEPQLLKGTAQALVAAIREQLQVEGPLLADLRFHHAEAVLEGQGAAASLAYQAIKQAMQASKDSLPAEVTQALGEFEQVLAEPRLTSVYQPIVSLSDGAILGWEALTRGPEGSRFRSPDALFGFAAQFNLTLPLERVCRRVALAGAGALDDGHKLFLNVDAHSINDPHFISGETSALLHATRLRPRNVVFEITERTSISNYATFRRALEHYRSQGFLIAVDDVGAGYSSLQSIAELKPDFMKLDMSLVKDIASSPIKQAILEALVTFAAKIGCMVIAEGIETREELRTVLSLGVQYGQGFYLARPDAPPPAAGATAARSIVQLNRTPRYRPSLNVPVEQLLEPVPTVAPNTPIKEVAALLKDDDAPEGVVVLDGNRPVGIVMVGRLLRQLAVPFGVALHYDRPVSGFMHRAPVIVESNTSIEQVSRQVTGRNPQQHYDYVVVTEDGAYRGVVSVSRLLHTLTEIRLSIARHANPLTGLPGNPAIHAELENRLRGAQPFTAIYADLNRFKAFNDAYGFQQGDKVLLFTARLLARTVTKYAGRNSFVGHVGGDDFIAVVQRDAEQICEHVIRRFDRAGQWLQRRVTAEHIGAPSLSISLAAVHVEPSRYTGPEEISGVLARLKSQAKARAGNVVVHG